MTALSDGLVVGIDLGTTAVKAGLSADGEPVVECVQVPVPWTATGTGAEIDPDLLWDVVLQAVRGACEAWPGVPVAAVGVSSFAESVVLIDVDGRPLAPLVAWHDTRGGPEADALAADLGADEFSARVGLPVSPLASAMKVRALGAGAGLDTGSVAAVLSATDWLAYRLCGEVGFDLSLAARTGWLDLARRSWADDVVAWTGLSAGAMPRLRVGGSARGRVRAGLPGAPAALAGALVVGAGMDHLVAAVGAGAAGVGDVWDSCGTAEAFVRSTAPLDPAAVLAAVGSGLTVGWHAEGEHQVVLGAQRSGHAFERVLRLLGVHTPAELAELEAGDRPGGNHGVVVEQVFDDSYSVRGLTSATTPQEVWAALVDQVADNGASLLAVTDQAAGPHQRLVIGGGWSTGRWFGDAKRRRHPNLEPSPAAQPGVAGAVAIARAALPHP